MNIYQKLAVATAGAALSLAVMETYPAHAATITYDFTVNVTSGSLAGNSGSGFLSYDTSLPTNDRSSLSPLTEFNFSFSNRTYTRNDIQLFDRLTRISFFEPNGEQLGNTRFVIPYRIPECNLPGLCTPNIIIDNNSFTAFSDPFRIESRSTGTVTYSRVPEPDRAIGTYAALGILGLGWLLKKKIACDKTLSLKSNRIIARKLN